MRHILIGGAHRREIGKAQFHPAHVRLVQDARHGGLEHDRQAELAGSALGLGRARHHAVGEDRHCVVRQ